MKRAARCSCLLVFAATISACVGLPRRPATQPVGRVAVLPFEGNGVSSPVLQSLRIALIHRLAAADIAVADPFEVDGLLAGADHWPLLNSTELAELLGVETVFEGEVQKLSRSTNGLSSAIELTLRVTMRDLASARAQWQRLETVETVLPAPEVPADAADVILDRLFGWPGPDVRAAADEAARRIVARIGLAAGRGAAPSPIDPMHPPRVDASSPGPPGELRVSTRPGGIWLQWQPSKGALVYRIEHRTTAKVFVGAGETPGHRFLDTRAVAATRNEYRVVAVDAAGNFGTPSRAVAVHLPPAGPTALPARSERDTTLAAYGSPYLMTGDVVVARGATLSVEAGTEVLGVEQEFRVKGTLLARGTAEAPITFGTAGRDNQTGSWAGLYFDGAGSNASVLEHCVIRGARRGIVCAASDPAIAHCQFAKNVTGLECVGGAEPVVIDCRFSQNFIRALNVRLGHPKLTNSAFLGLERVSVEQQTDPVDLNDNWWDTLQPSGIRDRIIGPVRIERCLGGAPPFATPVSVEALATYERAVMAHRVADKTRLLLAAIGADPAFIWAYSELATLYKESGRTGEAIAILKRCTDANPGSAVAMLQLGLAAKEAGKLDIAREALDRAIRLEGELSAAHFHLGMMAAEEGDLDEAILHLARCSELPPDSIETVRAYGQLLARQGRLGEAYRVLHRALEIEPGDTFSRIALGVVALELGRAAEARSALSRAVTQHPRDAYLRELLGAALARSGDPGQALMQWNEAARLKPESRMARDLSRIVKKAKR